MTKSWQPDVLIDEIRGEGDDARGRTRAPLARHLLYAHLPGLDVQPPRPRCDALAHKTARRWSAASSVESSGVCIGTHAQNAEDALYDAASCVLLQSQQRDVEGRAQPALLIVVDGRVGEAVEQRFRSLC